MRTRKNTNASTVRRITATVIAEHGIECAACGRETIIGGRPTDGLTLNMGHVVSEANGGEYAIENLLPICRRCNKWMGEADWATVAPMLRTPVLVPLVADPGTGETNMEKPEWA